ncbi:sulfotransferase [Nisaea acidiphila]|uniref:Sulfotransferase n=1 Tax=Nisaea acidiphila TaxID=1862145 RepID=A0A9J7AS61_9PROT|nr:sulfotransferase [Nisaea acidiphila]UUX49393.1 sulfotransferase [Nisaea acidiphila]
MLNRIIGKLLPRVDTSSPLLIGATGGSGTRALHGALKEAGFFVGTRLNHAGDAMDFEPFLDASINPVLRETRSLDYAVETLSDGVRSSATDAFRDALRHYTKELSKNQTHWGWKNPRSMYVLPFVSAECPGLRFLHLVRDGRDMALSDNQNQPNKHYDALFGESYSGESPENAIRLWAAANAQVADWGERELGKRYMRIRFEDLCESPKTTLVAVLTEAGFDPILAGRVGTAAEAVIRMPDSVGRWRGLPEEEKRRLTEIAAATLHRFGYEQQ